MQLDMETERHQFLITLIPLVPCPTIIGPNVCSASPSICTVPTYVVPVENLWSRGRIEQMWIQNTRGSHINTNSFPARCTQEKQKGWWVGSSAWEARLQTERPGSCGIASTQSHKTLDFPYIWVHVFRIGEFCILTEHSKEGFFFVNINSYNDPQIQGDMYLRLL